MANLYKQIGTSSNPIDLYEQIDVYIKVMDGQEVVTVSSEHDNGYSDFDDLE